MFASTGDQPGAQDEVPQAAGPGPPRTGKPTGQGAADRGALPQPRWFARQHLALLGQGGIEFGQRRAGTDRGHQFGGVVVHQAAMATDVQRLAVHRAAQVGLGVAAMDTQRLATGQGLARG